MILTGEEPYTAAERRHMWLWGAAAGVLLVVGAGVVISAGPLLVAVALYGVAAGLAHLSSQPRRDRWEARKRRRAERRTEALT